jgi:hypothetical protein
VPDGDWTFRRCSCAPLPGKVEKIFIWRWKGLDEEKEEEEEKKAGADGGSAAPEAAKKKRRTEADSEGRGAGVLHQVEGNVLLALLLDPGDPAGRAPPADLPHVHPGSR